MLFCSLRMLFYSLRTLECELFSYIVGYDYRLHHMISRYHALKGEIGGGMFRGSGGPLLSR